MIANNLTHKPENIFNVDETGIQLINKPGKVLAAKGSTTVYSITPREKGETISLIACCNAEGRFLPPVLIMKGVKKKPEFSDGLPNGSEVYMNKKSSYINANLFIKWFKEYFMPRKPKEGKTILILDGHFSHCNSIDLLELAHKNHVIIICLPSHTTQALQPLDRSFFKPFKTFYSQEAKYWMLRNKDRTLTRLQVGALIGRAWAKAATVGNATSGFSACGIFPLNSNIIPDYFFAVSDLIETTPLSVLPTETQTPSASGSQLSVMPENKESPTKALETMHPIPKMTISTVKHKQVAYVLTSPENLKHKKTSNPALVKGVAKRRKIATDSALSPRRDPPLTPIEDESNKCIECLENYFTTKNKADWIKCPSCLKWLHETCTMYSPHCNNCGKENIRKKRVRKAK